MQLEPKCVTREIHAVLMTEICVVGNIAYIGK